MLLAVWNEGIWRPSIHGDGDNKKVTFKSLDDKHTSFYLNITDYEVDNAAKQTIQEKWEPFCIEGNVLDVQIFGGVWINKYAQFTVRRDIEKKKKTR